MSQTTPFKTIFRNLIENNDVQIESVCIGVDNELRGLVYDDVEDDSDDLFLTESGFVEDWVRRIGEGLRVLSVSDFWVQSCWRRSFVLAIVSSYCHSLLELEVKNAWLSVDGLNPMPMLTKLTLEFIRLEDEYLNRLNECFPGLQVLNLIGVGGLTDPKIHLLNLKAFRWTVSNAPKTLTICAPNLASLELKCVKPVILYVSAPLLSHFHLSLERADKFVVDELKTLKTLHLESSDLCYLLCRFPYNTTIQNLILDSPKCGPVEMTKFSLLKLFNVFPNVSCLTLGSGVCSELMMCPSAPLAPMAESLRARSILKGLKQIIAYLVLGDTDITLSFISYVLGKCSNLSDMALLIHRDVDSSVASSLISSCVTQCSRVRWRWGTWKEGTKDCWISESI